MTFKKYGEKEGFFRGAVETKEFARIKYIKQNAEEDN